MSNDTTTARLPKKPATGRQDWHSADIKAELEKRGTTLARLSCAAGYHRGTLSQALRRPYPDAERIIAAALGKRPAEIWPSRYDRHGAPIRGPRAPRLRDSDRRADPAQYLKRVAV